MGTRRNRLVATAVIAAGLLVAPTATAADPVIGSLTPLGCISDDSTDICGMDAALDGLKVPSAVAVSGDGSYVYVTSFLSGRISQFERDATTGGLTFVDCVSDPDTNPDVNGCASEQDGLVGAYSIAISPDDASVYVTSAFQENASEVVALDRSTTTGILTPVGCYADDTSDALGCTEVAGLENPNQVTVSPDGSSAYVVSVTDDAIVTFDRDAATSALTDGGCIQDTESTGDCDTTVQGLEGAAAVAVSPDNASVYVASSRDDSVVRFSREPDGDLTALAGNKTGLDGAAGVAISPTGNSLYVANNDAGTVTWFPRAADGTLGSSTTYSGIAHAVGVVPSSDGASLYVVAAVDGVDSRVVHFQRDQVTGQLTQAGCVADAGSTLCGSATQDGLRMAYSLALSPDGEHAYVAGGYDDALVLFKRNTEEPTPDKVEGKVGATRHQHGPRVKVRVLAREALTVSLRGTLKVTAKSGHTTYQLKPTTFKAPMGETYRVIGLPDKAQTKAVKKALKDGKQVVAKVRWVLTDAAGHTVRSRARVYLAK